MGHEFAANERWTLKLLSADAVVLYDWLMALDFERPG